MVSVGLLVRLEAQHDRDEEVEAFLTSALPLVEEEPATTVWFAVRFGRHEYGIFDAFPDDEGRQAHLSGRVAAGLKERGAELFAGSPEIRPLDILASKVPAPGTAPERITKAILLMLPPKSGHESEVAEFLRGGRAIVEEEPGTVAWFAIRDDGGTFGIFDVFPDNSARFAHLIGRVPRELAKHATSLLGGIPDMDLPAVLAYKLPR